MIIQKLENYFPKAQTELINTDSYFYYEQDENKITLKSNEYDELTIIWKQNNIEIAKVQNVLISDVQIIDDTYESSFQFITAEKQSRMFKVQLKPHIKVSYELYFEVCNDCEE